MTIHIWYICFSKAKNSYRFSDAYHFFAGCRRGFSRILSWGVQLRKEAGLLRNQLRGDFPESWDFCTQKLVTNISKWKNIWWFWGITWNHLIYFKEKSHAAEWLHISVLPAPEHMAWPGFLQQLQPPQHQDDFQPPGDHGCPWIPGSYFFQDLCNSEPGGDMWLSQAQHWLITLEALWLIASGMWLMTWFFLGGTLPTSGMWIDSEHFMFFLEKPIRIQMDMGKVENSLHTFDLLICQVALSILSSLFAASKVRIGGGVGCWAHLSPQKSSPGQRPKSAPDPPADRLRCRLQPTMPLHSGGLKVRDPGSDGSCWCLLQHRYGTNGTKVVPCINGAVSCWRFLQTTLVRAVRWSLWQEKVEVGSERYLSYLDVFSPLVLKCVKSVAIYCTVMVELSQPGECKEGWAGIYCEQCAPGDSTESCRAKKPRQG